MTALSILDRFVAFHDPEFVQPIIEVKQTPRSRRIVNNEGEKFDSIVLAAKSIGVSSAILRNAITSSSNCGGFKWYFWD